MSNANVYVCCVLQRIMKRHRCRDDSAVFDVQNCETSEVVFDAFSLCVVRVQNIDDDNDSAMMTIRGATCNGINLKWDK